MMEYERPIVGSVRFGPDNTGAVPEALKKRVLAHIPIKQQEVIEKQYQELQELRLAVLEYIVALDADDDRSGGEQASIALERLRELVNK